MGYNFFENKDCEYYPCHKAERINCLFCFCPLYSTDCGGNCKWIYDRNGKLIKDCSNCIIPHTDGGYEYVTGRLAGKGDKMAGRRTKVVKSRIWVRYRHVYLQHPDAVKGYPDFGYTGQCHNRVLFRCDARA